MLGRKLFFDSYFTDLELRYTTDEPQQILTTFDPSLCPKWTERPKKLAQISPPTEKDK